MLSMQPHELIHANCMIHGVSQGNRCPDCNNYYFLGEGYSVRAPGESLKIKQCNNCCLKTVHVSEHNQIILYLCLFNKNGVLHVIAGKIFNKDTLALKLHFDNNKSCWFAYNI